MPRVRKDKLKLAVGDVIRAHPRDGFWVVAIVVGTRSGDWDQCLLWLTPWVFRHAFSFDEARSQPVAELPDDQAAMVEIWTYRELGDFAPIGRLDLEGVPLPEVSFEPKGWRPLCGPLAPHLGWEAVMRWRRIHDAEQLALDIEAAQAGELARRAQQIARLRPIPGTRDYSPKPTLPKNRGELWLGLRVSDDDDGDHEKARAVVESVTELIEGQGFGEWLGQSAGSGEVDVSFEVKSRRTAREAVVELLARECADRDYWIASDYEGLFAR